MWFRSLLSEAKGSSAIALSRLCSYADCLPGYLFWVSTWDTWNPTVCHVWWNLQAEDIHTQCWVLMLSDYDPLGSIYCLPLRGDQWPERWTERFKALTCKCQGYGSHQSLLSSGSLICQNFPNHVSLSLNVTCLDDKEPVLSPKGRTAQITLSTLLFQRLVWRKELTWVFWQEPGRH